MKQGQKEDILSLFSSVYKDMGSVESTAKAARGWQKDTHIQEEPKMVCYLKQVRLLVISVSF